MINIAGLLYGLAWVLLCLILLSLAKRLFILLSPFTSQGQQNNIAVHCIFAGFLLALTIILCAVLLPGELHNPLYIPSLERFGMEFSAVLAYALLGIFLLLLTGLVNDKLILYTFSNKSEILEQKNIGVGLVMAAGYIGSGCIIAGSIYGSLNMPTVILAYVAGQCVLILYTFVYQKITLYDLHKEIGDEKNCAAALALAGNLVAYSILLMKGIASGEPGNWIAHAWSFVYYALCGIILLPLLHKINDRFLIPHRHLSTEIHQEKNIGAGIIEASAAIAMSLILIFSI